MSTTASPDGKKSLEVGYRVQGGGSVSSFPRRDAIVGHAGEVDRDMQTLLRSLGG